MDPESPIIDAHHRRCDRIHAMVVFVIAAPHFACLLCQVDLALMAVGRDWIDLMGAVKVISLFCLVVEGRVLIFRSNSKRSPGALRMRARAPIFVSAEKSIHPRRQRAIVRSARCCCVVNYSEVIRNRCRAASRDGASESAKRRTANQCTLHAPMREDRGIIRREGCATPVSLIPNAARALVSARPLDSLARFGPLETFVPTSMDSPTSRRGISFLPKSCLNRK